MRTSSDDFSMDSNYNFVHLTNNCLQQFGKNYGAHEEGNTLSFAVLQTYLTSRFPGQNVSVADHIVPRIKDIIIDTILAVRDDIKKTSGSCFELLGYDFMIDEDLRVWLIEVNTNPYLGVPNAFIRELLPQMLDDMFSLVLDQTYPSMVGTTRKTGFEPICTRTTSSRRDSSKDSLYPIKEFAQKEASNRIPHREHRFPSRVCPVAKVRSELSPPPKALPLVSPRTFHAGRLKNSLPYLNRREKGLKERMKMVPTEGAMRNHHAKAGSSTLALRSPRRNPATAQAKRSILETMKDASGKRDSKRISGALHKLVVEVQSLAIKSGATIQTDVLEVQFHLDTRE